MAAYPQCFGGSLRREGSRHTPRLCSPPGDLRIVPPRKAKPCGEITVASHETLHPSRSICKGSSIPITRHVGALLSLCRRKGDIHGHSVAGYDSRVHDRTQGPRRTIRTSCPADASYRFLRASPRVHRVYMAQSQPRGAVPTVELPDTALEDREEAKYITQENRLLSKASHQNTDFVLTNTTPENCLLAKANHPNTVNSL